MVASLSVGSGEVVRPGHGDGPVGRSDELPVMPGATGWVLAPGDSGRQRNLEGREWVLHIRPPI